MRKLMGLLALAFIPLSFIFMFIEKPQRAVRPPAVVASPPAPPPPAPPPEKQPYDELFNKGGYYGDYKYVYYVDGNTASARFQPKGLPRDDEFLIGASQAVILDIFDEAVTSKPERRGGGWFFMGSSHKFAVTPSTQGTGEISTLVIERLTS